MRNCTIYKGRAAEGEQEEQRTDRNNWAKERGKMAGEENER